MTRDHSLTPDRWDRLVDLHDLLSTGRWFHSKELQAELKVGERTIIRDIATLRFYGASIPDQDPRGYRYEDVTFRFPHVLRLSEGELLAFYVAERIVEAFGPDHPYARELKEAIRKLSRLLTRKMPVHVEHLMHRGFQFDAGPVREVDPSVLKAVETGLRDLKRLEITYRTLSRDNAVSTRKVDPYFLHNYRGDWYLVAHCHNRQEPVQFAMSRIQAARVLSAEDFTVPKDFDAARFFGDAWGIYRGQEPERCRIWFSAQAARWIRERRWHASQKIQERADGSIILSMTVTVTLEIVRWVLAHGPEARAMEPQWLVDEVRKQIQAAHANLDAPLPEE